MFSLVKDHESLFAQIEKMSTYWMIKERLWTQMTGKRPRLRSHGCAMLKGDILEGGFISIHSPDLPGFRFMLRPEESEDIAKGIDALTRALDSYLDAYLAAQDHHEMQQRLTARISEFKAPKGRSINMVAELT